MANAGQIVERLAARLGPMMSSHQMTPLRAPEELLHVTGCWAGTPLQLDTQIHVGEGFLQRLQVAVVRSPGDAMSALTAVLVPSPDLAAPIFGCDLVAFRGKFVICALDLSGGELSDEDTARLTIARQQLRASATPREVPDFAKGCFSEHAAIVGEDAAPLDDALPVAFDAYLSCFEQRLARSAVRPWSVGRAEHGRFFAAMRANKRESRAMARLFGECWATRYFESLFFADALLPRASTVLAG